MLALKAKLSCTLNSPNSHSSYSHYAAFLFHLVSIASWEISYNRERTGLGLVQQLMQAPSQNMLYRITAPFEISLKDHGNRKSSSGTNSVLVIHFA
jgi:hypothetical protein